MKKLLFAITLLLLIIGCNSSKNTNTQFNKSPSALNDTVRIANDSLEYEVIIIDNGFSSWLASRAQPRNYYSQSYLENKNMLYVMEWNSRVLQPQRYGDLYLMRIDYSSNINYGYEVNYLIYNYFIYFQNTNKQKLGGYVPSR